MLVEAGGWDDSCLTEDADIGIRLSGRGERIAIIYDPRIVTREETPPTVSSFIKQRTRWNQGFLQILGSSSWRAFPPAGQLFSIYILGWPVVQAMLIPYMVLAALVALSTQLPVAVALIAFIPLFVIVLQLVIYVIGLRAFTKDYGLEYPLHLPFFVLLTFIPFYLLLAIGATRASWRYLADANGWEKTEHTGAHRVMERA
jgi:glycosyltransferase XagB